MTNDNENRLNPDAKSFYKFLTPKGNGGHSFYIWPRPAPHHPAEWTPLIEYSLPLEMCERGYHVLTQDQLLGSYMQAELWRVEVAGEIVRGVDKLIVRQARLAERIETWNARNARLFACDCAERVLPLFEKLFPSDHHPRQAIECARRFAKGKATLWELSAARAFAARTASMASICDPAGAAGAAAWFAAAAAFETAAKGAAEAAAEAASVAHGFVAFFDAKAAESKWQRDCLEHYLQLNGR
jgi:hypothetical protein